MEKLQEYFTSSLLDASESPTESSQPIVSASLPTHGTGFSIHEVAECFKLFLSDLPGGILGDTALFEALRNGLPALRLEKDELDLDFSCGGVEERVDGKTIAKILRDSSGRERRNLILLGFGVLAIVRNGEEKDRSRSSHSRRSKSGLGGDEDDEPSLSRTSSQSSGRLLQELRKVRSKCSMCKLTWRKPSRCPGRRDNVDSRSQEPASANRGTSVDPIEFRARSQSAASNDHPLSPPPNADQPAPSHTPSDASPHPPLRHRQLSGTPSRQRIFTDPGAPPPLPGADPLLGALVPARGGWASSGAARLREASAGLSSYPEPGIAGPFAGAGVAAFPGSRRQVVGQNDVGGGPAGAWRAMESSPTEEQRVGAAALGRLFAPVLLGDLAAGIAVAGSAVDGEEEASRGAGSATPGRRAAGFIGIASRPFLKKKEANKEEEQEKAKRQMRIAAWIVELLVRNWQSIVVEYGKGMEGVDAVVEGLWDYD